VRDTQKKRMRDCVFCDHSLYTIDKNGIGIIEWTTNPALQKKYILTGHQQSIRYLSVVHDKPFLISVSNTELLVWNRHTRTCIFKRTNELDFLKSTLLEFSNDFKHAIAGNGSSISVWNIGANKCERYCTWVSPIITFKIFNDTSIVIGFENGRIIVWNYLNGTLVTVATKTKSTTKSISCIECKEDIIYWSDVDGTIMFTNGTGTIGRTVMKFPARVASMKLSGKYMLFTLIDHSNEIWDLDAGKLIYYFNGSNPIANGDLSMFISNDRFINRMKNTFSRLTVDVFNYFEYQAILGLKKLQAS